jgi:ligand-binding sensor domain-containing protein
VPTRSGGGIDIPAAATATPLPTRIAPTFDPENPPTVSIFSNGNFVNGVAPMRSTVWAATGGGVVAWNKTTGSYVKFTTLDGLATNRTVATVVCPLPGLGVLFATPLGIQIFDTQAGGWKTLNSSNSEMRFDDVATLWCNVESGLLVAGYARQGIDLFDARAGSWRYVGEDEGLAAGGIRDIAVVDDGAALWLATQEGLYAYRTAPDADAGDSGEVTRYSTDNSPLTDNRIETLAADGSGAVWLTSGNTLYRTDGETWDTFTAGNGNFPAGRLTGLDVSSNGTIWLGSDQTQLCRFDPGVKGCVAFFQGQTGMAAAPLTSLTIDGEGDVYYTTAGGGLSIYAGETWRQLEIPNEVAPGNDIRSLAQTAAGDYWVAGNGGATRFVPDGGTVNFYSPANSPLPSVDVRVVLPVDQDAWIGAGGAVFYDGATWTVYGEADGLAGPIVQAIAVDAQTRVWLGTPRGLSIWTGSTFFNLTGSNGLPNDDITALQADGDAVWIGTRGGGLLRFQDNQLQLFNRSNSNLPGDTIYELARSPDGQVLIGTDQGLARFVDNRLIPEPDFAGQIVVALTAAPSGELWAATSRGDLRTFNGVEWELTTLPRLPSPIITELFFDAENALWVGTAQGGMARYTP